MRNIGRTFCAFALNFTIALLAPVFFDTANAQNRVDLDDMAIKGELLNDNRLRLSSRDKYKITDRVTYRTNFRREITDRIDIIWPEKKTGEATGSGGGQ